KLGGGTAGVDDGRLLLARAEALVPTRRDDRDVRDGHLRGDAIPHLPVLLHQIAVGDGPLVVLVAHGVVVVAGRDVVALGAQLADARGVEVACQRRPDGDGDAGQVR